MGIVGEGDEKSTCNLGDNITCMFSDLHLHRDWVGSNGAFDADEST